MVSIKLTRQSFRDALARTILGPTERAELGELFGDGGMSIKVTVQVDKLPSEFLRQLVNQAELNPNQRAMIAMRVFGVRGDREDYERIYDTIVETPMDFAATFAALGLESPNAECFINGRWYPVGFSCHCYQDEHRLRSSVTLNGRYSVGEITELVQFSVSPFLFRNRTGEALEVTVRDVLRSLGLRGLTNSTAEYNIKLLNAERLSAQSGRCCWLKGPVLARDSYEWWTRLETRNLGSKNSPRRVIVEPELEAVTSERSYFGGNESEARSRLPFVRVFSLDTKRFVYADVEDLVDYDFDDQAITRLHLPGDMLSILSKVFTASNETVFGDLIAGKHGGLVILAAGNPGVGKTLTAEVYAELTQRPLYVLELGELGTTATEVEENLNRVFARVARWGAVLQFDECEIFLAKRENDLERSAIVGIFLRLLDYYRGILFLTTNRPEVLDHAVVSRITLQLKYPDLDVDARVKIWRTMFEVAGLTALGDDELNKLAQLELNGREIRNLIRLGIVVLGNEIDRAEQLIELARAAIFSQEAN